MANLSLDDFAESKVKHNIFKQSSAPQDIRHELDLSFSKGFISRELYEGAVYELNDVIEKASKGEGSKGGHVIGHTKSGKAVYVNDKEAKEKYKNFTPQDHLDASSLHRDKSNFHEKEHHKNEYDVRLGDGSVAGNHRMLSQHHQVQSRKHDIEAHKQYTEEQHNNLSDDEKKIVKEQKKKQIEHHDKLHKFYTALSKHVKSTGNAHGVNFESDQEAERHLYTANHHKSQKERLEKE